MITCDAYYANIWIAGDYDTARAVCRTFCERGMCVSVLRVVYIYTGGEESGMLIRLMNYARFPKSSEEIYSLAVELAELLCSALCQTSYTVETPDSSCYSSRPRLPHA